jgi:phosphoenolpyruvate-protein kinase (PTS system EI component)
VKVKANISDREDVLRASVNGADGIGLYRMERAYQSCEPSTRECDLVESMRVTFSLFAELPITMCLWDGAGDAQTPVSGPPNGAEDAAGPRGTRLLMQRPDFMKTQLRALLRLAQEHDVRILMPSVMLPEELEWARAMLEAEAKAAGVDALPRLGGLIESPHAAVVPSEAGRCVEFLSVCAGGPTGLGQNYEGEVPPTQEGQACDDTAVLSVVQAAVTEKRRLPVLVVVCGDAAAHEDLVEKLLRQGVRHLSVAPRRVPDVKRIVRRTSCKLSAG